MPRAMSALLSALTKKAVGLSTDTSRAAGAAPSGMVPRSVSRELPGRRRAAMLAGTSAADVLTSLSTTRPLPVGESEMAA